MSLKMEIVLDVDNVTAERFLSYEPKNRWSSLILIVNTRPDLVFLSEPKVYNEKPTKE